MEAHSWKLSLPSQNLSNCPNGSQWVMEIFHECVQDGWDISSVALGLVSIVCFAAASFPQFYLACKTGIMDQALSLYFLLGWLGGDSLNLIGSFLAEQLPLQVYTAIYYVLADLAMISLYLYYKVKSRDRTISASINAVFLFVLVGMVSATSLLGDASSRLGDGPTAFKGRTLLSAADDQPRSEPFSNKEIVGFVIGSVSALLYLSSRVPQIYTNFQRKSTSGISYALFALVMLGNTLYGLSVLIKNPELGQTKGNYILHHLPWLVGSLGVLSLDVVISFQFLAYRQKRVPLLEERDPLLGRPEESLES